MSYNSPFTGNVIQPTDVSFRQITLSDNTQLEWPINGNATDDYAARIMEVTATSSGLRLYMPPADQASVGQDALIRNIGANAFAVKDYNGVNVITTVSPGQSKYIYITANPDNQGTWGLIDFGVGSSSVDAATLAGYGLLAITTTLNQSHPVTTFGTDTTATELFRAQTYVWTGGSGTLTLDSLVNLGNNWFMLLRNSGTGSLTVSPSGGSQINGSLSLVLQPTDSCMIVCSGAAFYTVGLGKSTLFNFTQLTKNVAAGGTFTLTPSEASNVIQKYTGTLAGDVTIIVPQTVQVYYIINETVGGVNNYTITISTGYGANAIVSANNQATLICDSANLLNANTILAGVTSVSLVNGNVGSPSLNFAAETSTGVYRGASGEFDIAILGSQLFKLSATGLVIYGDVDGVNGNFAGNVSGGAGIFAGNVSGVDASFVGTGNFQGGIEGGTFV